MKRAIYRFGEKDYLFKGIPVRDAKASIYVQPIKEDIDKGVAGDPENCPYALCLKRTLHSRIVFIYKKVAYIEQLDSKGRSVLMRYRLKKAASQFIRNFDAGKKMVESGYSFDPAALSNTLIYKRAQRKKYKDRQKIYDKKSKERKRAGLVSLRRRPKEGTIEAYRDGVGQVQFIGFTKKLRKHEEDLTRVKNKNEN